MKKTFTSISLKALYISMGLLIGSAASAQTYPERSIKILQGFAPGGKFHKKIILL
jgi:tripartite-type tricarboxylate transporter receptor subunit TctC